MLPFSLDSVRVIFLLWLNYRAINIITSYDINFTWNLQFQANWATMTTCPTPTTTTITVSGPIRATLCCRTARRAWNSPITTWPASRWITICRICSRITRHIMRQWPPSRRHSARCWALEAAPATCWTRSVACRRLPPATICSKSLKDKSTNQLIV